MLSKSLRYAGIENDIMDPVMQCTTLLSHSGFSQQKLVSFVTEIHTLSIDISFVSKAQDRKDKDFRKDSDFEAFQDNAKALEYSWSKTSRSQDAKTIKNNDKGSKQIAKHEEQATTYNEDKDQDTRA
ncbi:hypothetical protein Tco_0254934 [Tanacetum coccineum]